MNPSTQNPRVLIVTPEVTYLPDGMGNMANYLSAKAGGLADVSSALVGALFAQGADVHVALPDYRSIFNDYMGPLWPVIREEISLLERSMPEERIHLAQDRAFFYLNHVYSNYETENLKIALAFQREVINNIVPRVRPDLIHCNDWMTGLIPAMARKLEVPCLFTVHNIHTVKTLLAAVEDRGIDAAYFWEHLFYENPPDEYEETREASRVDMLVSGIFAAHFVNTVSPRFLAEIVEGRHPFIDEHIRRELTNKWYAECAAGILNAPDASYNPAGDRCLVQTYGPRNHVTGKRANKRALQNNLNLIADDKAPIFFWPSRLDPVQKGCQLLAEILYAVVSEYWEQNLQIVFVANGAFQGVFRDIILWHHFENRVALCNFDEKLARLAYAGADFILMPSRFEPCGLPQMIAPLYGTLTVGHDTGGLHDTVTHLNLESDRGNGFLFETYDSGGLFWAMQQAMAFYAQPAGVKRRQVERIMRQSAAAFNHANTARQYIKLYERMLERPLINPGF